MTRRAAIDARSAYVGLAIVDALDDPNAQPRYVFAGTIELGCLVDREDPDVHGHDKRRAVSDEDLEGCIADILDGLEAHRVESVIIEAPSGREFSRRFVEALANECTHRIVTTPRGGGDIVPSCVEGWPTDFDEKDGWRVGNTPGTRAAGRMLLGKVPTIRVPKRVPAQSPPSAPAPRDVAPLSEESRHSLDVGIESAKTKPLECLGGFSPRTLAVATGANMGVCLAERATDGTFRRVSSAIRSLDLSSPEERADCVRGFVTVLRTERVERVIIRQVTQVHGGNRDGSGDRAINILRAMATELVRANWLGGMLESACVGEGVAVITAPASHWERRVCGTGEGRIPLVQKIREGFPDWPESSTEAERDAGGLILWDALGQIETTAKRTRRSGKRSECTCPPERGRKPHYEGCPSFHVRVRKAGTVQMCAKCGEPRRGHVCTVST